MTLIDGNEYVGTPVNPEYGTNPKSGKPEARLMMEIVEGDLKGVKVPYKANMKDARSISYAKRDMKAAGWQGKTIATFVDDVTKASKAGTRMTFTARLARANRDDGSISEWWTVGSIGLAQAPLAAPTNDLTKSVDSWFSDAEEPGGRSNDNDPPPF